VLASLCRNPGAAPSPDGEESREKALAALRRVVRGTVDTRTDTPAGADVSRPSASSAHADPAATVPPAAPGVPASQPATETAAPETVRVSTRKLGAILLAVEELVGARIAASGRTAELRALATDLASWNRGRVRQAGRHRRGRGGTTGGSDVLESELLFTRTLESSLRKVAGVAHQDALSLAAITERLLEETRRVLLLPCSYLLGTLPGVVHDLAREQGKEADLLVSGEDIEIDRRVLDELKAPLIHLLRNCVDHGIEAPDARRELGKPGRGAVTITVTSVEGHRVELTVADDGCGIDAGAVGRAAVRLGLIGADEAARLAGDDLTARLRSACRRARSSPTCREEDWLAIVREKVEKLGDDRVTSTRCRHDVSDWVPLSLATFRGRPSPLPASASRSRTASVVRGPGEAGRDQDGGESSDHPLGGCAVCWRACATFSSFPARRATNGAARPWSWCAADRQIAFPSTRCRASRR
jgi:two-component system chemotaxis sensor kinase CheA